MPDRAFAGFDFGNPFERGFGALLVAPKDVEIFTLQCASQMSCFGFERFDGVKDKDAKNDVCGDLLKGGPDRASARFSWGRVR